MGFLLGMFTGWLLTCVLKYVKRRIRLYHFYNMKGVLIDEMNREKELEEIKKIELNQLIDEINKKEEVEVKKINLNSL